MPIYPVSEATQRAVTPAPLEPGKAFDAILKLKEQEQASARDFFEILAKANPQLASLALLHTPELAGRLTATPNISFGPPRAPSTVPPTADLGNAYAGISPRQGKQIIRGREQAAGAANELGPTIVRAFQTAAAALDASPPSATVPLREGQMADILGAAYDDIDWTQVTDPKVGAAAVHALVTARTSADPAIQQQALSAAASTGVLKGNMPNDIRLAQSYLAIGQQFPEFGKMVGLDHPITNIAEALSAVRNSDISRQLAETNLALAKANLAKGIDITPEQDRALADEFAKNEKDIASIDQMVSESKDPKILKALTALNDSSMDPKQKAALTALLAKLSPEAITSEQKRRDNLAQRNEEIQKIRAGTLGATPGRRNANRPSLDSLLPPPR
jgi:hypothetical protein